LNASATPCEIGCTVDEPEILISPDTAAADDDAPAEVAG
jgi:hypothetical protein